MPTASRIFLQLVRELLDLVVGQRELSQLRDVERLLLVIAIVVVILPKGRAPLGARRTFDTSPALNIAAVTFAAWAPLGPWTTSNSTRWPSVRVLKPSIVIAEKWTNTSSPPSRSMKP